MQCSVEIRIKIRIETSFKLCSSTTLLISGTTAGLVYARNGPLQQVWTLPNEAQLGPLNISHCILREISFLRKVTQDGVTATWSRFPGTTCPINFIEGQLAAVQVISINSRPFVHGNPCMVRFLDLSGARKAEDLGYGKTSWLLSSSTTKALARGPCSSFHGSDLGRKKPLSQLY